MPSSVRSRTRRQRRKCMQRLCSPSKLTLKPLGEGTWQTRPELGDAFLGSGYAHQAMSSNGAFALKLPPGRYQAVITRGPEYALWDSNTDSPGGLGLKLSRPFPQAGCLLLAENLGIAFRHVESGLSSSAVQDCWANILPQCTLAGWGHGRYRGRGTDCGNRGAPRPKYQPIQAHANRRP